MCFQRGREREERDRERGRQIDRQVQIERGRDGVEKEKREINFKFLVKGIWNVQNGYYNGKY